MWVEEGKHRAAGAEDRQLATRRVKTNGTGCWVGKEPGVEHEIGIRGSGRGSVRGRAGALAGAVCLGGESAPFSFVKRFLNTSFWTKASPAKQGRFKAFNLR